MLLESSLRMIIKESIEYARCDGDNSDRSVKLRMTFVVETISPNSFWIKTSLYIDLIQSLGWRAPQMAFYILLLQSRIRLRFSVVRKQIELEIPSHRYHLHSYNIWHDLVVDNLEIPSYPRGDYTRTERSSSSDAAYWLWGKREKVPLYLLSTAIFCDSIICSIASAAAPTGRAIAWLSMELLMDMNFNSF